MDQREEGDFLRDQFTLLMLLHKLKSRGFQTRRLKLQKLVYLADIFGTIVEEKPTAYTFRVYKRGPFSKEICSDIERLVILGWAEAEEMERVREWTPEQDRSFKYDITKPGIARAEKKMETSGFRLREKAVELALQVAGHLSGRKIRKLVYGEPNYIEAKSKGFTSIIDPSYKTAREFKLIANRLAFEKYGLRLGDDEVVWLYLNFMKTIQLQPKYR